MENKMTDQHEEMEKMKSRLTWYENTTISKRKLIALIVNVIIINGVMLLLELLGHLIHLSLRSTSHVPEGNRLVRGSNIV